MSKVTVNITEEQQKDLLSTALEGGSNYWYLLGFKSMEIINKYKRGDIPILDSIWEAIKNNETIKIYDVEHAEEEIIGEINLRSIEEGEQAMADLSITYFTQILLGDWDAETADIWFQYCVFKEIIYG